MSPPSSRRFKEKGSERLSGNLGKFGIAVGAGAECQGCVLPFDDITLISEPASRFFSFSAFHLFLLILVIFSSVAGLCHPAGTENVHNDKGQRTFGQLFVG
jgi:hypothetical protein